MQITFVLAYNFFLNHQCKFLQLACNFVFIFFKIIQTTPEVHNFSTPQHQYEHRGIGSPVGGGGDDIDGDDTHGGGGGGTHGERDDTHGGGDDIQGGGGGTHGERDGTHGGGDDIQGGGGGTHGGGDDIQGNLLLFKTPPPLTVDPSIGDETLQEYLTVQDEREQRLKIRS